MEGFQINYTDIYDLFWEYKTNLENLMNKIDTCENCINFFIKNAVFTGETGDAVKSYLTDVHITMLSSIRVTAQNLLDNMTLYKAGYYDIDNSTNFKLSEEAIRAFRTKLSTNYSDTESYTGKIQGAVSGISDISGVGTPSTNGVLELHEQLDQELLNLITEVQSHESSTVTALENSVELLLSSLNTCIAKIGLNTAAIASYESNSFYTDKDVYALANISELFYQQHEDNKDVYDAICEAEQNLKDAAEERETQGVWKTVAGVVLVGVGVACIIATAGAASPIVAAVGVAMGTGMTIYGVADSAEGAQDIYYGSIGDIDSTAVNDLKYAVFQGNEEAYYLTESVFAFAASAMIPIGQAASAGNLTFRSGATIVAKEGIATAAGAGAQKYTTDLTGNQTAGMLAGMAASMATAKGLNGIEAGAKKLAKPKLGDVGTDGGAVLNDADVGSAVEGGSTSSYSGEEWCRYFRETYGSDKVVWENATPSQLARSWQGTGKYIGVDDYVDTVVKKGTILYRGEPNGTEYFTTLDAIEQSGGDATNVFEGLQVEKHPIHGYRGEMQGYVFNEEIASAYGITNANPQFGKGGLPQYFVPNANDYIQKGILVKVDNITLRK
ncbi:T7SS effector LXG polymorphic toxin [Agathobacter rectalis]|uniref:T7SS effector LXG polymorphic toxin n=7 Tax=Agathobacter rectalis TaxID=39491 RepID=UPI000E5CCC86|nr:hypothetical protein DW798_02265 [Agathobacter rectalis]